MDRNREARRATMAANGLSRRRHRTNSLRDSPEEDGPVEMQEPARLRDRGTGKKDRDHHRERDRERERERERDRLGRSSKRRRGDRMMHSSNREDGEDSTEESVNDEEDDEDDDGAGGGGSVRMLPLNPSSLSSNHRKSFPPAKVFKAPPMLKAADEMIGVSVPRKARSASTKRSHECWASGVGIMPEQIHRQASTSPVRTGVTAVGMGPTPSPASPSSSNVSLRKKAKPNGPKLRPPKSSSKSSLAQDEIEIEIAEVLYGMRQPQGPTKQEIMVTDSMKFDSRDTNKSSSDKSRVSSPISNSQSAPPVSSSVPPQNSSSSVTPLSAVAPKRKKPRPVKYDDENPSIFPVRNSPISSTSKAESDLPSKIETCLSNLDKNSGSTPENGGVSYNLGNSQVIPPPSEPQPESIKIESNISSDSKPLAGESEKQDVELSKEPQSPKKESSSVHKQDDEREDMKATKANQAISDSEKQREEKFQIDLMAPPPPLRSSPERDVEVDFVARDANPMVIDAETEVKPMTKEDDKKHRMSKEDAVTVENDKVRATAEESEAGKPVGVRKEKSIDLQLDLEKADRDSGNGNMAPKRHNQNMHRQQQPNSEKTIQSSSVPLPMSVPSWPGGLPPMGYMAPLQGVVSMDGTTVSSAAMPPPHLLFNQPRPKRCATHYYIARIISYHQQLAKMNPFWPAPAGSASIYGAKHCNLNVVPSAELHGNVPCRAANSSQDKGHGHGHAMFPGYLGKEKGSQAVANMDNAQRKQILLQQALPPGAPSNILHAPAFIFPLNQQQAAAAATVRPGSVKPPHATGNGASSCASNASPASAAGTGVTAAPAMSFSYPNMPGNETQYLAILQNNGYSFPIPAHVGGPPAYRGTHAQALPFIGGGSFYPSQMLHPSQLQHPQLPQSQQSQQQGHQNASISSGSSSSQKHLQNQQQKANASNSNGAAAGGSLHGFPASKIQSSQPLQNHHASHPARQIESEMGGEESPLTADSRLSRPTMSIYGQNFAMPMQPPNFAMLTPGSVGGSGASANVNGTHGEKKHAQQHTGPKAGVETSQAFAMSFAPINGSANAPGLDLSSIAQNPLLHSHNYQIMAAAAQAAQQKKTFRVSEEGKHGGDAPDEERKAMTGKIPANIGQSIAFSRSDVSDPSMSAITSNTVIDSSARTLNLGSVPSRASASAAINSNATTSQQQLQRNQQQQILKQHQIAAPGVAAARSKTPSTSNGSVYSDHLPSTSSMSTKFPNPVSGFPQNLVQSGSNATQSPQWKNSARAAASQSPSPSLASTPSSSVKTYAQQQGRSQQAHTQISFSANQRSSPSPQAPPSGSTQSPSPPVMVGSPTTSMSKSAGSPRTTTTSTSNKVGQAGALSTQQPKSSQAMPTRKSSPVSGRNVPSILSGPQLTPSNGARPPQSQQQQHQQQQMSKQALQQNHLFFSSSYMHPQASQSNTSTPTTSSPVGFYLPRRGPEQQQRQGSSCNPSNGMVPLGPSIVNTSTSDSSKVVVGAASSMKGGLPTQGLLHPAQFATQPPGNHHQFVHAGIPYVQAVTPVQVKPTEQKQPAGE